MSNIYIHAASGLCALGHTDQISKILLAAAPPENGSISSQYSDRPVFLGQIEEILSSPNDLSNEFKTRNNILLHKTFLGIESQWKTLSKGIAPDRMAVIIGSSNAGIEEAEKAFAYHMQHQEVPENYRYEQQEYGSPSAFLAQQLNTTGPTYTISTACSSSAKTFISAARLLQMNICDIAIVGGADVLSQLTVNGFMALDAIDGGRSQPFAQNRQGIHLGEAASLFILSRTPSNVRLAGWGESSDAYHMAAPHPEGLGAQASMCAALTHAKLMADDIDYINLHGTATLQNDAMESLAVARIFGHTTPVSSTKSLTGHTLGAAGAIEALFCYLTLTQTETPYRLPIHWIDGEFDQELPTLGFVKPHQATVSKLQYILSNSFGFGGSNASLIFEKVAS